MLTAAEFLKEIDAFRRKTGLSDTEFGRICCNNSKFLPRLREGIRKGTGDIKVGRVNQIRAFMQENGPELEAKYQEEIAKSFKPRPRARRAEAAE